MSDLVLIQPELAVRDVVAEAFATMIATPAVIDYLVSGLTDADQDSIRTALANRTAGNVRLGFALENIDDYSVIVSLTGTSQMQALIDDRASGLIEEPVGIATLAADVGASEPSVLSLTGAIPSDVPATGTLRIGDEVAVYTISGSTVTLTKRGVRQTTAAAHLAGGTVIFHAIAQALGWPERAQVRIDVVSTNALFTAVVGHMLRAFLVRRRDDFEAQGVTLEGVGASDVAARPSDWPAQFYVRTLMASFTYTMAIPETFLALTDITAEIAVETTAGTPPQTGFC